MNWKNLKLNPPNGDDVVICLKDPKRPYRGMKQYCLAEYHQADPTEPELGAFISRQMPTHRMSEIRDVRDLDDDIMYINLEDIK